MSNTQDPEFRVSAKDHLLESNHWSASVNCYFWTLDIANTKKSKWLKKKDILATVIIPTMDYDKKYAGLKCTLYVS